MTMSEDLCHICNDRSTGKHYGAISCDGCKGFFRRSIRKKHVYVCRFKQCCDVTRNQRNACRSCRLSKCYKAGMNKNAIQNERDTIGKRKKSPAEPESDELIEVLIQSEQMCQQLRSTVIKSTEQVSYDCRKNKAIAYDPRAATLDDVGKSIHQQLVLIVEWSKTIPQFIRLSVQDQVALLKAAAAQMIVLGVAYRSRLMSADCICLGNDRIVSKENSEDIGDLNCAVGRIIDELVKPIRNLDLQMTEYVCLKAILFFNPVARDVVDSFLVEDARLAYLEALNRVCSRYGGAVSECRSGRLLLMLPTLQAVSQQMVEDVQLAHIFGMANVDTLMKELILHDGRNSPEYQQDLLSSIASRGTAPPPPTVIIKDEQSTPSPM